MEGAERNMTQPSEKQLAHEKKLRQNQRIVWFFRVFILMFFIGIWEVSTRLGWIDGFIFSSPSRLATTFIDMWTNNQLYLHIGITLLETFLSFLIVVGIGILIAILLWASPKLSQIFEPYLVILNSLPKSALAPLLIVWLGTNMRTIIVAGISVAIFGTIIHLYSAFSETDPNKIKLVQTLGGNQRQILMKVVIPASIPQIVSLMKVNIGLCLVGVIIGEFIGSRQGLGHLIIYGTQVFKLDWVILAIVILCMAAIGLYGLIALLEKGISRR